jgi:hypothetical protein
MPLNTDHQERAHSQRQAQMEMQACGRQFVADPTHHRISDTTKQLIDTLLLERISLAGSVHVTGVSPRWLYYYVNAKYAAVPRSVTIIEQKRGA